MLPARTIREFLRSTSFGIVCFACGASLTQAALIWPVNVTTSTTDPLGVNCSVAASNTGERLTLFAYAGAKQTAGSGNRYARSGIVATFSVTGPGSLYYWCSGATQVWHDGTDNYDNYSRAYVETVNPYTRLAVQRVTQQPRPTVETEIVVWKIADIPANETRSYERRLFAEAKTHADVHFGYKGNSGAVAKGYFGAVVSLLPLEDPYSQVPNLDEIAPPAIACLPALDGDYITDRQLRVMLDTYVPTQNMHSSIIVATQCFNGDMVDNLRREKSAFLAANTPHLRAYYGGYDDDAALALKAGPNRTSADVHAAGFAGRDEREHPYHYDDPVSLAPVDPNGPIKKRVVLVYAAQPEDSDLCYRETIRENFANDSSTIVITAGGRGHSSWDYDGTRDGLRTALEQVQREMTADTQFIFFITDHGALLLPTENVRIPRHGTASSDLGFNLEWTVRAPLAKGLLADSNNQPGVSLFFDGNTPSNFAVGDLAVLFGGTAYESFEKFVIDLDGDGDILDAEEGFRLFFPIPEDALTLDGTTQTILDIDVVNNTDVDLLVRTMSLDTGSVAPVPEPSAFILLGAGVLGLLAWRKMKRGHP